MCKYGDEKAVLRISYTNDREYGDYLAEAEYVDYLYRNGAAVAGIFKSDNGNLIEIIEHEGQNLYVCLFMYAPGKLFADNFYQYRSGVPISEYFHNCGKTLGKIHELSKKYTPKQKRYDFFDKYTPDYIDSIIPDCHGALKARMKELLYELSLIPKSNENYGMVHFDMNDGNYHIDFDNGNITVFDFDNTCNFFYMYDLADIWCNGFGWIIFEPDAEKRRIFMDEYFSELLNGYREETDLSQQMLSQLPLFINITLIEYIIDMLECADNKIDDDDDDDDGELEYLIKCLCDKIDYRGFFSPLYDYKAPFTYKEQ